MTKHERNKLLFKKHSFQVKALAHVLFTFFDFTQVSFFPTEKRFSVPCAYVVKLPIPYLNCLNSLIRRFSVCDYLDNNNLNIVCL